MERFNLESVTVAVSNVDEIQQVWLATRVRSVRLPSYICTYMVTQIRFQIRFSKSQLQIFDLFLDEAKNHNMKF